VKRSCKRSFFFYFFERLCLNNSMHTAKKRHKGYKQYLGFTIIEVMIVLAIVGLIMLIVFLAVPPLQRSSRNTDRKNYETLVYSEMQEYYNQNHHMPGVAGSFSTFDTVEVCKFLKTLPRVDSTATCSSSTASYTSAYGGTFNANCVTIQAGSYTICYQNHMSVDHGYIGPTDQISIMLAHWCNEGSHTDPSQPAWYPVAGNDSTVTRFAIWTNLEGSNRSSCIDNYAGTF
jgi:prepilin-type N-terminal cleavage/methylation domain-containing protein